MRNFLEILVRIWIVGGYYLVVCPILYLILLVIHPFNKNKNVTYKNVFNSDFITSDPYEIEYLKSGDKYYSYRTAWDFLIDRKIWFVK